MKAAIIGCGNISRSHLLNLSKIEDVNIVAVCDIKRDRADEKSAQYGAKSYYDYIEMLNNEIIDVVHICTPHYLHVEMACECLKRNINVLCEKPCAITIEELAKLRSMAKESKAQFGVCYQNRFNNSSRIIKSILESQKYGKVKGIRANVCWSRGASYYNDDWHGTIDKEGGGVLINQAVHTLDLIYYIYGKMPAEVIGHCFNDHLKGIIEVEDTVNARFDYGDGVIGLFNATTAFSLNEDVGIHFFCEKAELVVNAEKAYIKYPDGKFEIIDTSNDNVYLTGESYWGTGHTALINKYYECIKSNKKFFIDEIEGGKGTEQFLAVYKSNMTGESVSI